MTTVGWPNAPQVFFGGLSIFFGDLSNVTVHSRHADVYGLA